MHAHDPFAALNHLPAGEVASLTKPQDIQGLRIVPRVVHGVAFNDVQRDRDLADFGRADVADEDDNRARRFRLISSLPDRQHTGIHLLDEQMDEALGRARRRRIVSCLVAAVGLGIATLVAVTR